MKLSTHAVTDPWAVRDAKKFAKNVGHSGEQVQKNASKLVMSFQSWSEFYVIDECPGQILSFMSVTFK